MSRIVATALVCEPKPTFTLPQPVTLVPFANRLVPNRVTFLIQTSVVGREFKSLKGDDQR